VPGDVATVSPRPGSVKSRGGHRWGDCARQGRRSATSRSAACARSF